MSDLTVQMSFQGKSVVQGMQQVGKEADKLSRKVQSIAGRGYIGPTTSGARGTGGYSKNAGMAALEASRAIEDFAVAGMRGALNNIPGVVMSLTGSTGLTAAISLAAVGFTLLGKKIYDFVTDAEVAKTKSEALKKATEDYANSVKKAESNLSDYRQEQARTIEQERQAERIGEVFRRFGDPTAKSQRRQEFFDAQQSGKERIAELNAELAKVMGATQTESPSILPRFEESVANAKQLLTDLVNQRSMVESQLERISITATQNVGEKIKALEVALAAAESEIAKSKANIEADKKVSSPVWVKAERMMIQKQEGRAADLRKEIEALKMGDEARKSEAEKLKEKIKAIEAETKSAEKSERLAKLQLDYAKEEEQLRQKIEQAKMTYADKPLGPDIQLFLDYQKSLMENIGGMRINGSDMLSSIGRIGGSGAEFANAVATVNYQRESLKSLREIARNTKGGKVATYN